MNRAFEDLTGWKYTDVIGRSFDVVLEDPKQLEPIVRIGAGMKLGDRSSKEKTQLRISHRVAGVISAEASVRIGGTPNVKLMTVKLFVETSEIKGIFSVDRSTTKITCVFCFLVSYLYFG